MLEVLNQRIESDPAKYSNCTTVLGSYEDLSNVKPDDPTFNGKYDFITVAEAFHFFSRPAFFE